MITLDKLIKDTFEVMHPTALRAYYWVRMVILQKKLEIIKSDIAHQHRQLQVMLTKAGVSSEANYPKTQEVLNEFFTEYERATIEQFKNEYESCAQGIKNITDTINASNQR